MTDQPPPKRGRGRPPKPRLEGPRPPPQKRGPKPRPKDPSAIRPKPKSRASRTRTTTVEVPTIHVRTTLTVAVHEAIVREIRRGRTQRQAAALARIPLGTLDRWLIEGRRDVDAEQYDTQAAALAVEVEHARAEHEGELIDLVDEGVRNGDRVADASKWVRWRVGVSSPRDFLPGSQASTEGTVFELISPDDALQSVREKIASFLAAHEDAQTEEAEPVVEEPVA